MPGLLQDPNAPQQPMPPEQGMAPMPPEGMPPEAEADVDENNPAFQAAVELINQALYQQGAADGIHQQLLASDNPVVTMAEVAYEITAIADERTEGQVADELMVMLATVALSEIADIAVASGIQLTSADVAEAMKQMILRYVGEMGHDTRELQAAMDAIPPEQFNQMAGDPGGQPADPAMMQEV